MDEKIRDEDVKSVRCVRDFFVWGELLNRGFSIADINKDKKFVCPVIGEKCTFKSVVYFYVIEGLDEAIEEIYRNLKIN